MPRNEQTIQIRNGFRPLENQSTKRLPTLAFLTWKILRTEEPSRLYSAWGDRIRHD